MKLTLEAHAKINLTLDILSKRTDGYHEVRMIMQSLALSDSVTLERREEPGILLETDAPDIPRDSRNLCVKAAENLYERCHLTGGLRIGLAKQIPAAAGLAGGSSDAAAVLLGMRTLYDLALTDSELYEEGRRIGADVPFCMLGKTALSEGIGEILTPVPAVLPFAILLVKPAASVSTREIYEAYDSMQTDVHPDTEGMLEALSRGDAAGISRRLANVLEPVTERFCPEIGRIRALLLQNGASGARMSGSGPTVFGLFSNREAALQAERSIRSVLPDVFSTVTEAYFPPKHQ